MKKPNIRKKKAHSDISTHYVTSDQIYEQWLVWKNSADVPSQRTIPDQLAKYILIIADRMLLASSFFHYDQQLKEDMKGSGILKMIKNLKNMKEEKHHAFFNYLTLACYCGFVDEINKHYKHLNTLEQLRKDTSETYRDNLSHIK